MSSRQKQLAAIGAIVLGVTIALYAILSRKSEEELIKDQLDALAQAVRVDAPDENPIFRANRLSEKFRGLFVDNVRLKIPELTSVSSGRKELVQVATRAGSYWRSVEVSFSDISISKVAGEANRKVETTAVLTAEEHGEMRRDERHVTFGFTKKDGDWLIDSIERRAERIRAGMSHPAS